MAEYVKAECNNCDWKGTAENVTPLNECEDLTERLEPGCEVPLGDCPVCRAFCYIMDSKIVPA